MTKASKNTVFYASGFNAFGQLNPTTTSDIHCFQKVSTTTDDSSDTVGLGEDSSSLTPTTTTKTREREEEGKEGGGKVKLLFAGWSETAFLHSYGFDGGTSRGKGVLVRRGGARNASSSSFSPVSTTAEIISGFGDHDGLAGVLDSKGRVYFVEKGVSGEEDWLSKAQDGDEENTHPRVSNIAIAGNGRVCITTQTSTPTAAKLCYETETTQILEFASMTAFKTWYHNTKPTKPTSTTTNENPTNPTHHTLPDPPPPSLNATTTTFTALTPRGNIYTWGDPRHPPLLTRPLGPSTPSQSPHLIPCLAGLLIKKVVAGAWLNVALSQDGAAYVFGCAAVPGAASGDGGGKGERVIGFLRDVQGEGGAALVEIGGEGEGGDAGEDVLDILDVAAGDAHVVLLCEGGRVFVVGENGNGQLGLGGEKEEEKKGKERGSDGGGGASGIPRFVPQWREVLLGGVVQGRCVAVYAGPRCSFLEVVEGDG